MCCFRSTKNEATRAEPPTRLHRAADPRQPERAADSQARLPEFPVALRGSFLDENKIEQYQERTRKQAKSLGVWGCVFIQLNIYFGSDGKQLSPHSASQVSKVVLQCLQKILTFLSFVLPPQCIEPYSFFFGVDKLHITPYFHSTFCNSWTRGTQFSKTSTVFIHTNQEYKHRH